MGLGYERPFNPPTDWVWWAGSELLYSTELLNSALIKVLGESGKRGICTMTFFFSSSSFLMVKLTLDLKNSLRPKRQEGVLQLDERYVHH